MIRPILSVILAATILAACQPEVEKPTFEEMRAARSAEGAEIVSQCATTECGRLNLDRRSLTDYGTLSNLSHVRAFMISYTDFSDLNLLRDMTQLTELHIGQTKVTNISSLSKFTNLKLLHIQNTPIADYAVLSQLRGLEELAVGQSGLADISFVRQMPNLKSLDVSFTDVKDLSALRGHPSLEYLNIDGMRGIDISVLATLPNLKTLTTRDQYDMSPVTLEFLKMLEERGVQLVQHAVVVC